MANIPTNNMKSKGGIRRIINASIYSRDGLIAAWQNEAAFRQLLILHSILLIIIFLSEFTITIKMILISLSFLSLITELINTAIEAIVDYISLEKHPLAKRAKDVGSAAQMLALITLTIVWIMALNS